MVFFVNSINDIFDDEEERIVSGAIILHEGYFRLIYKEKSIGTYKNFHEAAVEAFGKGIDTEYFGSFEEYFEYYNKRISA